MLLAFSWGLWHKKEIQLRFDVWPAAYGLRNLELQASMEVGQKRFVLDGSGFPVYGPFPLLSLLYSLRTE